MRQSCRMMQQTGPRPGIKQFQMRDSLVHVCCRLQEETWQLACPDASDLRGQVAGSPRSAAADLQLAVVQPEDDSEPATPRRPGSRMPQPDWQLLCQRWFSGIFVVLIAQLPLNGVAVRMSFVAFAHGGVAAWWRHSSAGHCSLLSPLPWLDSLLPPCEWLCCF